MTTFLDRRNLDFTLREVLNVESLTTLPRFADHDSETLSRTLDAAYKIGADVLWPAFREMDRKGPELEGGTVRVHNCARRALRVCGDGGWINAQASFEDGGSQLPGTIMAAFRAVLSAANYSAAVYPALNTGAAELLSAFGDRQLVDTYVPHLHSGCWQGTMAMTEPHAGSSLADMTTSATPSEGGFYLLKGQKIFISCGDHDGADNVIHMMLARIAGAPGGSKGISLFVVPKLRPNGDGGLESNDVSCAAIYHKLGYRGAPIAQLSLGERDDCRGWLVGKPHSGLRYMFKMMNGARIEVGMGATAMASAAYHAALAYTKERPQGRAVGNRDYTTPQVPIIQHPDVKRMLLFQRSVVEGSLALVLRGALYADLAGAGPEPDRARHQSLLGLLTPVIKSFPAEMGILSVSQGLQCLGGYGYCAEFPLEQYYRDIRIHTLHEGTTAMQAKDLLGRKVAGDGGHALGLLFAEVEASLGSASAHDPLESHARQLSLAVGQLKDVTTHLAGLAMSGKLDLFLADATLYLEFFGLVVLGWIWLDMAIAATEGLARQGGENEQHFYEGKLLTARYYFAYELPKMQGLATRLVQTDGMTISAETAWF